MNTTDADAGPASRGWVVVSLPSTAAPPLPPLPAPPPAVNNTAIRLCLGALPRGDDAEAVGTCIRGGAAARLSQSPPLPASAQGCEGSSEAPSGSAAPWVLCLILGMAVAYLAIALRKEQRANRAALSGGGRASGGGGGGGSRAVELQGVALLP